uniref:B box-type domain-containing protein n=1 Tax=Salix viminalis TaxID=40686 RepID=A0A6N2L9W3_SALVM
MVEHATCPQWVLDMIETEFYEPCGNHSVSEKGKYCNFFCMDCTRSPFCDLCYSHKVHDGHRVYKSSHCPGVQIPHLRKLFEISEIQPYSINGNFIIYIRQRTSKENINGSVINQRQIPLRNHKRTSWNSKVIKIEWSTSAIRTIPIHSKDR